VYKIGDIEEIAGEQQTMLSRSERTAMKDSTMKKFSRVIIIIAAIALSSSYYLPLWTIDLDAPQYPEGLGIEIWINKIQGQNPNDLNKINNLNHYIGMKKIKPESIKELKIMPWIMRTILLFGIIVGITGRRRLLMVWLILFVIVAAAGLVDFYLWGYDYGHNLDMEHAIIKVPGMSYQPPLIGSKNLLNFKATSLPGAGGWIAICSFFAALAVWIIEYRNQRKGTVV
jgi:copper chaperone NosL